MIKINKLFTHTERIFIFFALFVSLTQNTMAESSGETIGRLCQEIAELKKNLAKEQAKNRKLDQELAQKRTEIQYIQFWLAGISDQSTGKNMLDEYSGLLLQLKVFSDLTCRYTMKNLNLYDLMRRDILPKCNDEITKSRLAIHIDELEKTARELVVMSQSSGPKANIETLKNCRVLEKNHQLGVVLLSVGASDGIAPGLVFHSENDKIELRIVSVRRRIAAAIPIKGELNAINIGMKFSPLNNSSESRPFVLPGVKMRLD